MTNCHVASIAASPSVTRRQSSARIVGSIPKCAGTETARPSIPCELQPGDLIGFSGTAIASHWINLVTYGIPYWGLSHIGIVGENDGQLLIYESCYGDPSPCVIRGERFSGTQAHTLADRLETYDGKIWLYRLTSALYDHERVRLARFLSDSLGVPYDMLGAFRAGGVGLSTVESLLRPADLTSLFCSEWCCAALTHIGRFRTDHVSRWSPNRLIRSARRQGIVSWPIRLK